MTDPNIAPEGKIWVCMSCFKKAKNLIDLEIIFDDECIGPHVLCDEVQPAPGFYAVSGREDK